MNLLVVFLDGWMFLIFFFVIFFRILVKYISWILMECGIVFDGFVLWGLWMNSKLGKFGVVRLR